MIDHGVLTTWLLSTLPTSIENPCRLASVEPHCALPSLIVAKMIGCFCFLGS